MESEVINRLVGKCNVWWGKRVGGGAKRATDVSKEPESAPSA